MEATSVLTHVVCCPSRLGCRHLDLILYLHFRHVSSLLCMLPYNQLKQPAAAPTGRQGDTSGAVKGLGERCLSLNPVFDWSNPHTEKVRDPLHINSLGRMEGGR